MKTDETRNLTNQGCSIQVVPVMWEPEGIMGGMVGTRVIWSGSVAFGWIISCRILRFTAVSLTSYTRSLRSLITPRSGA